MVVFNECRIDKEGKNLIVDVKVDSLAYYENIYLKSITVDTDETFIDCGPNVLKCQYHHEFSDTKIKTMRLEISYKELGLNSLNDNMFFVYIEVGGIPAPNTPCGRDKTHTMAVAVNLASIYNVSMGYIKELGQSCETPKGFIDTILRLKAFELSLKTGNYSTAINLWKKLFKVDKYIPSTKNCNCNGIYP